MGSRIVRAVEGGGCVWARERAPEISFAATLVVGKGECSSPVTFPEADETQVSCVLCVVGSPVWSRSG